MFTPGSRACAYRTASGRAKWINRDPIGERGGISLYGFVANSPLDLIDPLGLLTKEECAALRDQIFGKAAALLDDLRRYDPVEDFKGGHPMGGGKFTKPGGHHVEIRQRQRGLGKDIAKFAKECGKCDDNNWPGPIPRSITDMGNQFVEKPHPPLSLEWTDFIPGTPGQLVAAGDVAAVVGALAGGGALIIGTGGAAAPVVIGGAVVAH